MNSHVSRWSDERRAAIEILVHGDWMAYETLLSHLVLRVSPGRAVRRYERETQRRLAASPGVRYSSPSETYKIRMGQRNIATETVAGMKRRGFTEDKLELDGRYVRLSQSVDLPDYVVAYIEEMKRRAASKLIDRPEASEASKSLAGGRSTSPGVTSVTNRDSDALLEALQRAVDDTVERKFVDVQTMLREQFMQLERLMVQRVL